MAIKPYNYASPQKVAPSTGGRIKPFTYAAYTPPPVPEPPAPSFFSNFTKAAIDPFAKGFSDAFANAPKKSFNPAEASKVLLDNYAAAVQEAGNKVYEAAVVAQDAHTGLLKKGVKTGQAVLGTLSPIFSAAMAPLTYASSYPGIGQAADSVNAIFSAVGNGGGTHVATLTVDQNPFLSQQTKDTIRPLVYDTAALVSQLVLGKATEMAVSKIAAKVDQINNHLSKDPVFHGASSETAALIKENGFQGSKDFPGNGMVSLTTDAKEAGNYAKLTGANGEVLRVSVDAKNIKTYPSMEAYTKAIDAQKGLTGGAAEQAINAPYDAVRIKVKGQPDVLFAKPDKVTVVSPVPAVPIVERTGKAVEPVKAGEAPKVADIAKTPEATIKPFDYSKVEVRAGTPVEASTAATNVSPETTALQAKLDEIVAKLPDAAPKQVDFTSHADFSKALDEFAKTSDSVKVQEAATQYKDIVSKATDLPPIKPVETPKANALKSRVFERLQAEQPDVLKGDLTYDRVNLKADAERAVSLIEKDRQEAFDIAMGQKEAKDVTSTAVNIALAEKALADGQTALYGRLIRNRSLAQTRRGQEIVSERGSVTDNSTSTYVKELLASRLDALGKNYLDNLKLGKRVSDKTKAVKQVDEAVNAFEKKVKAKKLTVPDALDLLDYLACV